jgi:hypothetical protein
MGASAWAGGGAAGIGAVTVGGARRTSGVAPGGKAVCPAPGAGVAPGDAGAAFGARLFGSGPVRGGGVPAPPPAGGAVVGAVTGGGTVEAGGTVGLGRTFGRD